MDDIKLTLPPDPGDGELRKALHHLQEAEHDLEKVHADEVRVLHNVEEAIHEIEEARHHLVIVTVDGQPHKVKPGKYQVAEFKIIVGVASDRELDELKNGVLEPLKDESFIEIHGCEVFVSHVPTGSSA